MNDKNTKQHQEGADSEKRIIIHTGPGKTGSSAIQAWLTKNREQLIAEGVYYPKHNLSKEQISSGNLRTILSQEKSCKRKNTNEDWLVDPDKITLLLEEFDKSDCSVLLISSEFFFHRMVDIQKHLPKAEFIAYIRNPVELLESNYNQAIKRHGTLVKFSVPKSLDRYFWQYLSKAYETVGTQCMHLRPYDESLMVGNNIVSDLLSVIGIDKLVENKRINPSFTFASLEFKRLLNHFELGVLEPKLDNALQGCTLGNASYSLMNPEDFTRLNQQSCQQMGLFIEKFNQHHLLPLLDAFKNAKQRKYQKQEATCQQIFAITEYLRNKYQPLYFQLKALVSLHNNLLIDNNIIYQAFDVEPKIKTDESDVLKGDSSLLKHFDSFGVARDKREQIAYELSCYFIGQQDWRNGILFAKTAYRFKPNNKRYQLQVNKALIQGNLYSDRNIIIEPSVSVSRSTKSFIKRVLRRIVYTFKSTNSQN